VLTNYLLPGEAEHPDSDDWHFLYGQQDGAEWQYCKHTGAFVVNQGVNESGPARNIFGCFDRLGLAVDMHAGTLTLYRNGELIEGGVITGLPTDEPMHVFVELPLISAPDELPYDTTSHPRLIGADNGHVGCGMLRLLSKPLADVVEQQRAQGNPGATSAVQWASTLRYYRGQSYGWEMEDEMGDAEADKTDPAAKETDTLRFSRNFSPNQHGPGHSPLMEISEYRRHGVEERAARAALGQCD
jgi:hypothetical protein